MWLLSILDFGLKRQNKKAKRVEVIMRTINSIFGMELNINPKILAFSISSF